MPIGFIGLQAADDAQRSDGICNGERHGDILARHRVPAMLLVSPTRRADTRTAEPSFDPKNPRKTPF